MSVKRSSTTARVKLETLLEGAKGLQGKTGYFENAKYLDGTPVAYVAAIQEFGSGAIPPRPTMRPTAIAKQAEWAATFGEGAQAVLAGSTTPFQVMEYVALNAAADVGRAIEALKSPPLSPLTLLARKYKKGGGKVTGATLGELSRELHKGPPDVSGVSTKPLVETGLMFQSVTGIAEYKK